MNMAQQFTAVAIGDRAILIEGAPGTGKSSLALSLIDRGAVLIGDDGVLLQPRDGELWVGPHPNTRGLLEVRNIGLVPKPVSDGARVRLLLKLDPRAPRFVEEAEMTEVCGISVPLILLTPHDANIAIKAELALARYGKDTD